MKLYIRSTDYLAMIPKKYKKHIISIDVSDSDNFNKRGQRLRDYRVEWDNGYVATFENLDQMRWMLKEYTDPEDGYYYEP